MLSPATRFDFQRSRRRDSRRGRCRGCSRESIVRAPTAIQIDVGEFDRATGRSFAELGADIRRLQRTQPAPPAPPIGHVWRFLRLDSTRVARVSDDRESLFGGIDTTLGRFRDAVPAEARAQVDSLGLDLAQVRGLASTGTPGFAGRRARAGRAAHDKRSIGVSLRGRCTAFRRAGARSAISRSRRAPLANARFERWSTPPGIVIDGRVDRELVAAGDSVPGDRQRVQRRNAGHRYSPPRGGRAKLAFGHGARHRDCRSARQRRAMVVERSRAQCEPSLVAGARARCGHVDARLPSHAEQPGRRGADRGRRPHSDDGRRGDDRDRRHRRSDHRKAARLSGERHGAR